MTDPIITSDPDRLGGTPVFAGTRVPVATLFEYLRDGASLYEFLYSYEDVSQEAATAVIDRACHLMCQTAAKKTET